MAKSATSNRPRLAAISEEMRRISALLSEELVRWPGVNARPMFGMRAFYRGASIFAMLPDKRALECPTAIAYKLSGGAQVREGAKWQLLELEGGRHIRKALACLKEAYRRAGAARK